MAARFQWTMPTRNDFVGGWRLHRILGEGGNAVVWATDPNDSKPVAVKVLRVPDRAESYDRFAQEVRVHLEALRDVAGVLPLLEADVPKTDVITTPPFLVMPIATPLADHLGHSPTVDNVIDSLIPIAKTLARLLEQFGISHRDIKPSNLYWHGLMPAIGDFGLVAVPGGTGITRSDRDLGPRDLLPPEMRAGREGRDGPPADVFELALTVFMLLGGDPPRDGLRPDESAHRLADLLGDGQLRDLDRILQRATRCQPEERITMADFARELEAWRHPPSVFTTGLDPAQLRERFTNLQPEIKESPNQMQVDSLSELQNRIYMKAKPGFEFLQALGLESVSRHNRLFERIDPEGRGIITGSSVIVGPSGADGALWLTGGVAHGISGQGRVHVIAGWCMAPFDGPPTTLWSDAFELDPLSLADLHRADAFVDNWVSQASAMAATFLPEVERFASSGDLGPESGPDNDPPEVESLAFTTRSLPDGSFEITVHAHLIDRVAGLAGVRYNGSPSQLRIRGPGGETRDGLLSVVMRASGTPYDSYFESPIRIEPFDPDGTWTVEYLLLVDEAGHQRSLAGSDLEALGFESSIRVAR